MEPFECEHVGVAPHDTHTHTHTYKVCVCVCALSMYMEGCC